MDMQQYTATDGQPLKLKRHLEAIRRNKDILAHVFMFLSERPPNASAAKEAFGEMSHADQTAIWSVSTNNGGIWETWERDAIKYGDLEITRSYGVWVNKL